MQVSTLDELATNAGQRTGNFAKDMAGLAANFACGLYKEFPGAVVPNVAASFLYGLWDTICAKQPSGLPPAPSQPLFSGGQCDAVVYAVRFDLFRKDGSYHYRYGFDHYGPIGGVRLRPDPDYLVSRVEVLGRGLYETGNIRYPIEAQQGWYGGFAASAELGGLTGSIAVRRIDGNADNCGNLPVSYPPTTVPNDRVTITVPYDFNGGGRADVPVTWVLPRPGFPFTVNVGGIDFNFNFNGCSIGDTEVALADKLKQLEDLLKEIQSDLPKPVEPPSSGDFDKVETSGESSEDKDNVLGLQWVQVELIVVPTNAKRQDGGVGQDVLYCGWFEWIVDGYYLPREPVHFAKSVFRCPDGATGYAYTLYEGFKARVTEFKRKETNV